jgi:hypothetical protein
MAFLDVITDVITLFVISTFHEEIDNYESDVDENNDWTGVSEFQ